MFWLGIFFACSQEEGKKVEDPEELNVEHPDDTPEQSNEVGYEELPPGKALLRVSMALRGTRPSKFELLQMIEDPERLQDLATGYVNSDEFGDTIRDMFAEILLVRTGRSYAKKDEMSTFNEIDRQRALSEEPLALIESVVNQDLPFTKIVTVSWSVMDEVAATKY